MSDRRVLSVSAALITAGIFLFLLGTYPSWRSAIRDGVSWSRPAEPSPPPDPAAAARSAPVPPTPAATGSPPTPAAASPAPPPRAPEVSRPDAAARGAAASPVPTFDIVRVEPTGDSVVAARAAPGAAVVLLDEGKPIARAQADGSGQVAFVPPPLAPGEHSLMLSVGDPNAPGALSSQSVAVSVTGQAKAAPLVALIQPDQPTRILSDTTPPAPAGAAAPPPAPPVSVSAIDVEEMGSVFASGRAPPGSQCRVYLNGSFVAPVTAGPDGRWSLKIQHGMRPGHYAVRVDQVGSADGAVQARAEVPFDYPATLDRTASLFRPRLATSATPAVPGRAGTAEAAPSSASAGEAGPRSTSGSPSDQAVADSGRQLAATTDAAAVIGGTGAAGAAPTIVAQLLTTKVMRGDSLWRISRKMLGHGRHYTQIYAANTSQIRDPRLIYPGQIFVMPQTP